MHSLQKYSPQIVLYVLISTWLLHFAQPIHYSTQVKRIRTEQRRAIRSRNRENDGRLLKLSVAIGKFNQLCGGDKEEISLDGNMYDIVSYQKDRDTVHCVVIIDDAEADLHRDFGNSVKSKHRTAKPISFFWLYASHNTITLALIPAYSPLIPKTPETSDKPCCGYPRFISQPPEYISA